MSFGRMEKYCLKHGHTWTMDSDIGDDGYFILICMRCGAKQLGYIEEEEYEPDVDDDGTEEQTE